MAGVQVCAYLRHIGQDAARTGQKRRPRFGHHHPAPVAVEQRHAQIKFQIADAAA
jgi:hypothetical protein